MASHTTSAPDRAIVAHPPPEHVNISPTRRRIGVTISVVGVVAVLVGTFWVSAPQWLFIGGGILMVASLFLLSPYLNIFGHWKRDDIRKLFRR
jgi:membrane protein YdbS with pleckstrin-like domain